MNIFTLFISQKKYQNAFYPDEDSHLGETTRRFLLRVWLQEYILECVYRHCKYAYIEFMFAENQRYLISRWKTHVINKNF
jgi:hypothetical protein